MTTFVEKFNSEFGECQHVVCNFEDIAHLLKEVSTLTSAFEFESAEFSNSKVASIRIRDKHTDRSIHVRTVQGNIIAHYYVYNDRGYCTCDHRLEVNSEYEVTENFPGWLRAMCNHLDMYYTA